MGDLKRHLGTLVTRDDVNTVTKLETEIIIIRMIRYDVRLRRAVFQTADTPDSSRQRPYDR